MQTVLEQYAKHIIRINHKAHAMKSQLTHGERKAVTYYTAAAQAVQNLIDQPQAVATEGKFVRL
jgi:hypothetical protein